MILKCVLLNICLLKKILSLDDVIDLCPALCQGNQKISDVSERYVLGKYINKVSRPSPVFCNYCVNFLGYMRQSGKSEVFYKKK